MESGACGGRGSAGGRGCLGRGPFYGSPGFAAARGTGALTISLAGTWVFQFCHYEPLFLNLFSPARARLRLLASLFFQARPGAALVRSRGPWGRWHLLPTCSCLLPATGATSRSPTCMRTGEAQPGGIPGAPQLALGATHMLCYLGFPGYECCYLLLSPYLGPVSLDSLLPPLYPTSSPFSKSCYHLPELPGPFSPCHSPRCRFGPSRISQLHKGNRFLTETLTSPGL